MRTAVPENHSLAGTGRAMNHPMTLAERARQLLLLQVHDLEQRWKWRVLLCEQTELPRQRVYSHLGVQVIAHAVDLGQAQLAREDMLEHIPEPLLEGFSVDCLGYFVLKQHLLRVQHLGQISALKLLTGNRRHYHAPAEGHDQVACIRRT